MTKKIPLTRGYFALVDDDDYEKINEYVWSASSLGHRRTRYALTNIKIEGRYTTGRMHRLILEVSDSKLIVDHINGNGLDNRKENLRIVNASENATNVSINKRNKSGYKGVTLRKDRGTWSTEVRKNYKNVYRSASKCIHLAGLKYNDNAVKVHGDKAWLNEVKECSCNECTSYKRTRYSG